MILNSGTAIIISIRKLQEKGRLLKLFCRENGVIAGYNRKVRNFDNVCVGDIVNFCHNARVEEQLGTMNYDITYSPISTVLDDSCKLVILNLIANRLNLLMQGQKHVALYDRAYILLTTLERTDNIEAIANYAIFEYLLIQDLGFGLDLSKCAVSGMENPRGYISPKTCAVVSKEVGEPYKEKLWPLPKLYYEYTINSYDIKQALEVNNEILQAHTPYGKKCIYHNLMLQQN